MKTAIMQPYFLPYIGYFQLMKAADLFVVYDQIQFSKRGWIHRNRFLQNGKDKYFTLPLKKDSDYLDVAERKLADDYISINNKTLRKLEAAYRHAPFYKAVFPIVRECFLYSNHQNLFDFIFHSLYIMKRILGIECEFIVFSTLCSENEVLQKLKGEEKVIEICKSVNTTHYVNPIGGQKLYHKDRFAENGIKLSFLQSANIEYKQFDNDFYPNLSIIDFLMFNGVDAVKRALSEYHLIEA
jgi:hypothetical protein